MATVIWWVRRDLRLIDNQAFSAALASRSEVIPVFILDPYFDSLQAEKRKSFFYAGLQSLDASLRGLGSRLVIRSGHPAAALSRLIQETGAERIFAEEDFSPYARRRDDRVAACLPCTFTGGLTVHHPAAVAKRDGSPYTVFTPFSKAWKALPFPSGFSSRLPDRLLSIPELDSDPLPTFSTLPDFPASEREAQRRLEHFLEEPIFTYQNDRNRLDLPGTSILSPYFRFGMISARQAAWAAMHTAAQTTSPQDRQGCDTWLNELIWREFYQSILYHFPDVLEQAFKPNLRAIPWRENADDLYAWQRGLTGYPVVDACMRQMAALSWMHNRGRMITASFLVKDLLINWQEGERWFMRSLVDGDPASNNGGWQWTAGTGTDAAPYFRIFNPVSQSQKCDPEGNFIRYWVPELAGIPYEHIHAPWLAPLLLQKQAGVIIGKDYPLPIVDHALAKIRTLSVYNLYSKKGNI